MYWIASCTSNFLSFLVLVIPALFFMIMEKKNKFAFSVRYKILLIVSLVALFIGGLSITYFSIVTVQNNRKAFNGKCMSISNSIVTMIDIEDFKDVKNQVSTIIDSTDEVAFSDEWGSDEWNAYTAKFDSVVESESYKNVLSFLKKVHKTSPNDIDCVYLVYLKPEIDGFVYLVDSAEDPCPPGCVDKVQEFNKVLYTKPEIGFPPYETNTEAYGHLLSGGVPIFDKGQVIGYALVDIRMETVLEAERESTVILVIVLIATVLLTLLIAFVVVHYTLTLQVNKIIKTVRSFDPNDLEKNHEIFNSLNIKSRDEIGELAEAMKIMEHDLYESSHKISSMDEELKKTQEEADKMSVLATKDALTGVRNKAAYNRECEEIELLIASGVDVKFAVGMIDLNFLKEINDGFGHGAGDEALIKLSKLICDTFVHSSVFRIGGDEFVVIFRNADYENIDQLINEFNKQISIFHKGDQIHDPSKISAAIGYSRFIKGKDVSVDDVFKRADKAMYERKHEMKEN